MVFNPRRLSGNWSKQLRNEASRASSTRTPAKNPISRSVGIRHLAAATCFNTNCGILDSLCPDHYPCKRDSIALRTAGLLMQELDRRHLAAALGDLDAVADQ